MGIPHDQIGAHADDRLIVRRAVQPDRGDIAQGLGQMRRRAARAHRHRHRRQPHSRQHLGKERIERDDARTPIFRAEIHRVAHHLRDAFRRDQPRAERHQKHPTGPAHHAWPPACLGVKGRGGPHRAALFPPLLLPAIGWHRPSGKVMVAARPVQNVRVRRTK